MRIGVMVEQLAREGDRFRISTADATYEAGHVVVATGAHAEPRVPPLRPSSRRLSSSCIRRRIDVPPSFAMDRCW
ncbi:MAG: hypothetical protein ABIO99_07985 [Candidatus Limnocylindria bacterium]